jgi:hypothetical protein
MCRNLTREIGGDDHRSRRNGLVQVRSCSLVIAHFVQQRRDDIVSAIIISSPVSVQRGSVVRTVFPRFSPTFFPSRADCVTRLTLAHVLARITSEYGPTFSSVTEQKLESLINDPPVEDVEMEDVDTPKLVTREDLIKIVQYSPWRGKWF